MIQGFKHWIQLNGYLVWFLKSLRLQKRKPYFIYLDINFFRELPGVIPICTHRTENIYTNFSKHLVKMLVLYLALASHIFNCHVAFSTFPEIYTYLIWFYVSTQTYIKASLFVPWRKAELMTHVARFISYFLSASNNHSEPIQLVHWTPNTELFSCSTAQCFGDITPQHKAWWVMRPLTIRHLL